MCETKRGEIYCMKDLRIKIPIYDTHQDNWIKILYHDVCQHPDDLVEVIRTDGYTINYRAGIIKEVIRVASSQGSNYDKTYLVFLTENVEEIRQITFYNSTYKTQIEINNDELQKLLLS